MVIACRHSRKRKLHSAVFVTAIMIGIGSGDSHGDFLPRNYYGAFLEPTEGVLHGAGQTYHREDFNGQFSTSFDRYADVLGDSQYPLLFMVYSGFENSNSQQWYEDLDARLDGIRATDNRAVVPQLGAVLPNNNSQNQLLSQSEIDTIVNGLASLNRPVYFRPGYEANGPWNNYDPSAFIQNFRALSTAIRAADLPVAMVWNVVVGEGGAYSQWDSPSLSADDYYPGDEYVDWWSLNAFGTITFDHPFWSGEVDQFLAAAHAAGKPVLMGEATPQFVGAEDESDWADWFAKFFDRIISNPGIKAHTYINWDWPNTDPLDNWNGWRDASLENAHPTVRANYTAELSNSYYIHASSKLPDFLIVPEPSTCALVLSASPTAVFLLCRPIRQRVQT